MKCSKHNAKLNVKNVDGIPTIYLGEAELKDVPISDILDLVWVECDYNSTGKCNNCGHHRLPVMR